MIGVYCTLVWGHLDTHHKWGGDFALYITQAIGLSEGRPNLAVELNRFTVKHTPMVWGPVAYPWGTSLLLAPIYSTFGLDFLALKFVNVALMFGLICSLIWWTRDFLGTVGALSLGALVGWNESLLRFHNNVLSDLPFMAVSWLTLFWYIKCLRWVEQEELTRARLLVLCLGMWAGVLFRSNGGLVVLAIFIHGGMWLLSHRSRLPSWRWAGGIFVSVLAIHWLFLGGLYETPHPWSFSSKYLERNWTYYVVSPLNGVESPWRWIALVWGLALATTGLFRLQSEEKVLPLYFGMTLVLVLLLPWRDMRYIFTIIPIGVYFCLRGCRAWLELSRSGRWLGNTSRFAIVCLALIQLKVAWGKGGGPVPPDWPTGPIAQEMFNFVRTQTSEHSVFVFNRPRPLSLFTGRKAFATGNPRDLEIADYVILMRRTPVGPVAKLDGHVSQFKEVFYNRGFIVFDLNAPSLALMAEEGSSR